MAQSTAQRAMRASVSPSQLLQFLTDYLPIKRPIIVHSSPGLGKSQIVKQAARVVYGEDSVFSDVRAGQLDGSIVRGIPDLPPLAKGQSLRQARFAPLSCWPLEGRGVIFLDELDKAVVETQNALLELLLDRRLGDYEVPDGIVVAAAANRMTDRAGSNRMTTALKSRCIHLHLELSLSDWLAWATGAGIHPVVIAFIELKGVESLYAFDPADVEADSFPCPRTWEMLSDAFKVTRGDGMLYHLCAGTIGANATATEFVSFAKHFFHLPPKAEVLKNPDTFKIPEEGALRWALSVALVDWVKDAKPQEAEACVKAALRLSPELTTFSMVHIIARRSDIFRLPIVLKWAMSNQALLNRRKVNVSAS